jgi:signal transduction histidine kinase
MLGSVTAVAVIGIGGYLALRHVAVDQAKRETRGRAQAEGQLVESAGLTNGILRGERGAIGKLDDLVLGQILGGPIVRVKLWSRSGKVIYSDEPALIGRRYPLDQGKRRLFKTGGTEAEVSDLNKPENRFERPQGQLLEAYTPIRTPNGTQVMFEIYERASAVNANADRLLTAFSPPVVAGLAVLLLIQIPLAWRLARRLQREHHERELLLQNAVEASTQERQRIAADLHDGVVQDLAGVAFGLAPLAAEAERRGNADESGQLTKAIDRLRQGVRDLRTLLVEIHPPNLESAGMRVALSDLLSPLGARGIATSLDIDDSHDGAGGNDTLVYRVAREAIRNAQLHGRPTSVHIALTHPSPGLTRLVVTDDGAGFAPEDRARRAGEGHLGLSLLEDIVRQADGKLAVASSPGDGTTVTLEVPTR